MSFNLLSQRKITYVFSDHIEPQTFQNLEIIDHGLAIGGREQTIWPITLVQCSEHENELAIQQRTHDTINSSFGDRSEPGITVNFIIPHSDGDVVQIGRVRGPQIGVRHIEQDRLIGNSGVRCHFIIVVIHSYLN